MSVLLLRTRSRRGDISSKTATWCSRQWR